MNENKLSVNIFHSIPYNNARFENLNFYEKHSTGSRRGKITVKIVNAENCVGTFSNKTGRVLYEIYKTH